MAIEYTKDEIIQELEKEKSYVKGTMKGMDSEEKEYSIGYCEGLSLAIDRIKKLSKIA